MDTFTTLWNRVQLRATAIGPDLAQDLVRDAFNQLVERREWSWLMKASSFYPPTIAAVGTAGTTSNNVVITGSGTAYDVSMVGKQIRVGGTAYPTYTIVAIQGTTALVIDRPWSGPTAAGQPYTLFQCYFPVPDDFASFYSLINPQANYRLRTTTTQAELDSYDPQRSQSGISYAAAFYDYTQINQGVIGPCIQVTGSGPAPVSTTTLGYSYPATSIYSIEITQSGVDGQSQFSWRQDGVTGATGIVTDAGPLDLSNGVQVYFPAGTYVQGDVFAIVCSAGMTAGVERYELWPRPISASYAYPYLYVAKLPELTDDAPTLPPAIARRGDVILEMALANAALYPGTAEDPNPYRDPSTSNIHRANAERLIMELEKKDDDVAIKDLIYSGLPYFGPFQDGAWLQTHAIYPY